MAMVLNHLQTVARNSDKNKMSLDQLAVCLGPVLLCPSPSSSDNADLEFKKHIEVLKYLLEIWTEQNGDYDNNQRERERERERERGYFDNNQRE